MLASVTLGDALLDFFFLVMRHHDIRRRAIQSSLEHNSAREQCHSGEERIEPDDAPAWSTISPSRRMATSTGSARGACLPSVPVNDHLPPATCGPYPCGLIFSVPLGQRGLKSDSGTGALRTIFEYFTIE
jgi:hypothetical protein